MDENDYVELLFVEFGEGRDVVQAPLMAVEVGGYVEYMAPAGFTKRRGILEKLEEKRIGRVVKKLCCEPFDNEWSCVAELTTIFKATGTFSKRWDINGWY